MIAAGKLPLMACLPAFVVTFAVTRGITRLIRTGRGPFRDRVTRGGTHVHHAVPGLMLLVVGAFTAVGTSETSGGAGRSWPVVAGVLIGVGTSLVLDEFGLILHLTDVYWSNEGRLSVDLVSLAAACLGLALVGFSPVGVRDVGTSELAVRFGGTAILAVHGVVLLTCVLEGKYSYSLALLGMFVPLIALVGALRLARPTSVWARHRYGTTRLARATSAAARFDRRFDPLLRRWQDLVGGTPSRPDPAGLTRSTRARSPRFRRRATRTGRRPRAVTRGCRARPPDPGRSPRSGRHREPSTTGGRW